MAAALVCRHSGARLLGASVDASGSILALTVQNDGVICYSTSNQKRISSHALGTKREEFQTASALDAATGTIAAVIYDEASSSYALVTFSRTQANFKTIGDIVSRVPLPGPAHSCHILHTPTTSKAAAAAASYVAVVLQDSSVGTTSADSVQLSILPASASGSSRHTFASSAGDCLVVATQSESTSAQLKIYKLSAAGLSLLKSATIPPPSATAPCTLTHLSISPSAYALLQWSDGTVTVVSSIASAFQPNKPSHFQVTDGSHGPSTSATTDQSRKRKSTTPANAGSSTPRFLTAAVDSTQFIVLNLESSASQSQIMYTLRDAQFGCPLGSGSIAIDAPLLILDLTRCSILQITGEQVLIRLDAAFFTLHIHVQPVSLLSLVAKLALVTGPAQSRPAPDTTALSQLPAPTSLDASLLTYTHSALATLAPGAVALEAEIQDVVLQPVPAELVSRLDDISNQLLRQLSDPAVQPASRQALDSAVSYISGCRAHSMPVPSQLLSLTATQLVETESWQLMDSLLSNIEAQALTGCAQLLSAVVAAQRYQLLPRLCTRLDEVVPEHVVAALQLLLAPTNRATVAKRKQYYETLRSQAEALVAAAEGSHSPAALDLAQCAAAAVDGFSYREVLLHPLLALPLDMVGLQGALRTLSTSQVEALVGYLAKWVAKYSQQLGDAASLAVLPQELLFPWFSQVLEWLRVTLDAHLARLLMQRKPLPALEALETLLGGQVAAAQKLMTLQGAAEHIQQQAQLPAAHMAVATQYTAEVLDLRVLPKARTGAMPAVAMAH